MSKADDCIKALRRCRRDREKAEGLRRKAMQDTLNWAAQAQAAGVPVTRIASELGLSRQAVYDLLEARPSEARRQTRRA